MVKVIVIGGGIAGLTCAHRLYSKGVDVDLFEAEATVGGNIKTMNIPMKVGLFCNRVYGDYINDIKIYPKTVDVLKKLNSYSKGIITNTPLDCTENILDKFMIRKFFDVVLTSSDVSHGKPSPDLVIKSCELLNVKPKDVVLVGDTDSDVKAGHAAGCKVIGLNVEANFTIKKISDLLELLEL